MSNSYLEAKKFDLYLNTSAKLILDSIVNEKPFNHYIEQFIESAIKRKNIDLLIEAAAVAPPKPKAPVPVSDDEDIISKAGFLSRRVEDGVEKSIQSIYEKLMQFQGGKKELAAKNYYLLAKKIGAALVKNIEGQLASEKGKEYLKRLPRLKDIHARPDRKNVWEGQFYDVIKLAIGKPEKAKFYAEQVVMSIKNELNLSEAFQNILNEETGDEESILYGMFGSESDRNKNLEVILKTFLNKFKTENLPPEILKHLTKLLNNIYTNPSLVYNTRVVGQGLSSKKTLGQKITGMFGKMTDFDKKNADLTAEWFARFIITPTEKGGLGYDKGDVYDLDHLEEKLIDKEFFEDFKQRYEALPLQRKKMVEQQVKSLIGKDLRSWGAWWKSLNWKQKTITPVALFTVLVMLIKLTNPAGGAKAIQDLKDAEKAPQAEVQASAEPNQTPVLDLTNVPDLDQESAKLSAIDILQKDSGKDSNLGKKIIKARGGFDKISDREANALALHDAAYKNLGKEAAKELLKNRGKYDAITIVRLQKSAGEKVALSDDEIKRSSAISSLLELDSTKEKIDMAKRIIQVKGGLDKIDNNDAYFLAYTKVIDNETAKELLKNKANYKSSTVELLEKRASEQAINASEIVDMISSGKLTSKEAAQEYLKNIDKIDGDRYSKTVANMKLQLFLGQEPKVDEKDIPDLNLSGLLDSFEGNKDQFKNFIKNYNYLEIKGLKNIKNYDAQALASAGAINANQASEMLENKDTNEYNSGTILALQKIAGQKLELDQYRLVNEPINGLNLYGTLNNSELRDFIKDSNIIGAKGGYEKINDNDAYFLASQGLIDGNEAKELLKNQGYGDSTQTQLKNLIVKEKTQSYRNLVSKTSNQLSWANRLNNDIDGVLKRGMHAKWSEWPDQFGMSKDLTKIAQDRINGLSSNTVSSETAQEFKNGKMYQLADFLIKYPEKGDDFTNDLMKKYKTAVDNAIGAAPDDKTEAPQSPEDIKSDDKKTEAPQKSQNVTANEVQKIADEVRNSNDVVADAIQKVKEKNNNQINKVALSQLMGIGLELYDETEDGYKDFAHNMMKEIIKQGVKIDKDTMNLMSYFATHDLMLPEDANQLLNSPGYVKQIQNLQNSSNAEDRESIGNSVAQIAKIIKSGGELKKSFNMEEMKDKISKGVNTFMNFVQAKLANAEAKKQGEAGKYGISFPPDEGEPSTPIKVQSGEELNQPTTPSEDNLLKQGLDWATSKGIIKPPAGTPEKPTVELPPDERASVAEINKTIADVKKGTIPNEAALKAMQAENPNWIYGLLYHAPANATDKLIDGIVKANNGLQNLGDDVANNLAMSGKMSPGMALKILKNAKDLKYSDDTVENLKKAVQVEPLAKNDVLKIQQKASLGVLPSETDIAKLATDQSGYVGQVLMNFPKDKKAEITQRVIDAYGGTDGVNNYIARYLAGYGQVSPEQARQMLQSPLSSSFDNTTKSMLSQLAGESPDMRLNKESSDYGFKNFFESEDKTFRLMSLWS